MKSYRDLNDVIMLEIDLESIFNRSLNFIVTLCPLSYFFLEISKKLLFFMSIVYDQFVFIKKPLGDFKRLGTIILCLEKNCSI